MSNRTCGECQLCCRLLPVKGINKPDNTRCKHQKFGVGCKVYRTREMPMDCVLWNCRWLVNDDTAELSRPDRAHYVIDVMPDFVTVDDPDGQRKIPVVQVWCDPRHSGAYHDPALRRYLSRRALEGYAAIIRYGAKQAFVLFAPELCPDNEWHEVHSELCGPTHNIVEVMEALNGR